jgi:cellulose biosynthesis protein BcsQ
MSAQIICVHTSKGGTGKSTITTILASYLTYELSKRVLVIDADAPQFSIDSLRHREQTIYQNISQNVTILMRSKSSFCLSAFSS